MTSSFMSSQANSTVLNYDTFTFFTNLLANATSVSHSYCCCEGGSVLCCVEALLHHAWHPAVLILYTLLRCSVALFV